MVSELALFRQPKVLLAVLALVFVPSLYVLIYVSSVWDPYGNLSHLPAALVNQDVAVTRAGREVNLGAQLVDSLNHQKPFAFVHYPTPEAARADVRVGRVFFALLIPADFSAKAVAGDQPAQLGLYVSEGGNYTASIVTKRFGAELAHTLNEKLNLERWAALVGAPDGSPEQPTLHSGLTALQTGGRQVTAGAAKIRDGSARVDSGLTGAVEGADQLASGSAQLVDGSARLTEGVRQIGTAVAEIRSKLPDDDQLGKLGSGSDALNHGAAKLKDGLDQLQQGAGRLVDGTEQLKTGAAKVPLFGSKLANGTQQLRDGANALGEGIGRADVGAGQLSDGLKELDSHLQPLATGLTQLNAGLKTMSEKLPARDQLDLLDRSMSELHEGQEKLTAGLRELHEGAGRLHQGAAELATGTDKLAAGLDQAAARFEAGFGGTGATHLAASVETVTEVFAPVLQNGPAFSPYFTALSLWIGAVMMSFVFHLRRLPDTMRATSRTARWLAKIGPLAGLGLLQATVVVTVLRFVLHVPFAQPGLVWAMAALGSLTFVSLITFFITLLGDAGRLLAVVLLIFQLAASGGIYPIELSPEFYQKVHGCLPFTFLVHSFRATMFSAFDGHWQTDALLLAAFAATATLGGVLLARWKFVALDSYGPAAEF